MSAASIFTAWCSEIGSLTSLDACNSGASSDVREPISLDQTVCLKITHVPNLASYLLSLLNGDKTCKSRDQRVLLAQFDDEILSLTLHQLERIEGDAKLVRHAAMATIKYQSYICSHAYLVFNAIRMQWSILPITNDSSGSEPMENLSGQIHTKMLHINSS